MKNLLIIAFLAMSCYTAQAQWKVGPKAGIGTILQGSDMIRVIPMSDHGLYDLKFTGGSSVTSAGLMMYRDLGPFFLQADVLGTQYSLDYQIDAYTKVNDNSNLYTEQFYLIETNLMAGVNVKNFKFGLGPVFEINVDKDTQLEEMYNYVDNTNKLEHGFTALIGYNLGVLHFDVKYVNKFSGITDNFQFGQDEFKYNGSANRLSMTIGLAF